MPHLPGKPDDLLRGAYVELHDLLALRFRPLAEPRLASTVVSARGGTRLSKQRGRGIDFSEVRLYQPGDDVRTIDWRVTARKNVPHTKVFREERERLTLVVVDQTQSMFFGSRERLKSVAAAEFAALTAWRAIRHNDRIGGIVIGNDELAIHKPYRNLKSLARFLGDLARLNRKLVPGDPLPGRQTLSDALLRVRRLARSHYRIYFVSDFDPMGDHWRDTFRALSRHNELVAIRVYDPLEQELPPADQYTVTDGRQRWQFDAGDSRLRERYRRRFDEDQARFETLCRNTKVATTTLATTEPVQRAAGWL
ncbi:MAG: DUF58 domain-containing protein [Pseudomonadales bacterium]